MISTTYGLPYLAGLFNRSTDYPMQRIQGTTISSLISLYKLPETVNGQENPNRKLPSLNQNDTPTERNFNYMEFPYNITLALYYTTPSSAGTGGVEVSGNGYQRIKISRYSEFSQTDVLVMGAAALVDGYPTIKNQKEIHFPKADADWTDSTDVGGTDYIRGFGVFGDGNLMLWGNLTTPIEVLAGDVALFDENNLKVSIRGAS